MEESSRRRGHVRNASYSSEVSSVAGGCKLMQRFVEQLLAADSYHCSEISYRVITPPRLLQQQQPMTYYRVFQFTEEEQADVCT